MKYRIDLTGRQIITVQKACEFYSRFLAGQWEIPDELQWSEFSLRDKPSNFWEIRNLSQDMLNQAKVVFFDGKHSTNSAYGIGSKELSEYAKIAYDIYRPILETFSKESRKEHKKNGDDVYWTVYDSPGLTYSEQGRIKVDVIND